MKITLRKAAALQAEIRNLLGDTHVVGSTILSEFTTNVEEKIAEARDRGLMAFNTHLQLNSVLFEIRQAVAVVNAASGVSEMLAKSESAQADIRILQTLVRQHPQAPITEIKSRLNKVRNVDSNSYGHAPPVQANVFTAEDIAHFNMQLAVAKRTVRELKERLLELNTTNHITLSESAVDLLKLSDLL